MCRAAARAAAAAAAAAAAQEAGAGAGADSSNNEQQERRPRGGSDLHKGMFKQHFMGAVVDGVGALSMIDESTYNNRSSSSSSGLLSVGNGNGNDTISPVGGMSKSASLEELNVMDTSNNSNSSSSGGGGGNTTGFSQALKMAIIGAVNELFNEIDNYTTVCQKAQDYIHAEECILVYGYSKTVEMFLKAAANKRNFQVRRDKKTVEKEKGVTFFQFCFYFSVNFSTLTSFN